MFGEQIHERGEDTACLVRAHSSNGDAHPNDGDAARANEPQLAIDLDTFFD